MNEVINHKTGKIALEENRNMSKKITSTLKETKNETKIKTKKKMKISY